MVEFVNIDSFLFVVLLECFLTEECMVDGGIVKFRKHIFLTAKEIVIRDQECFMVD